MVTDFNSLDELDELNNIDEVYIAIGKKLSLFDLIYLKKKKEKILKKLILIALRILQFMPKN